MLRRRTVYFSENLAYFVRYKNYSDHFKIKKHVFGMKACHLYRVKYNSNLGVMTKIACLHTLFLSFFSKLNN